MAWVINKTFEKSLKLKITSILYALFGVSVILGGVFPCDDSCLVPTTLSGYLHAITGMPAMITAPVSFILLGKLFETKDHFNSSAKLIVVLGIVSIFAMIASASIFPTLNLMGLGQRIAAFFQLLIPFIVAYKYYTLNQPIILLTNFTFLHMSFLIAPNDLDNKRRE